MAPANGEDCRFALAFPPGSPAAEPGAVSVTINSVLVQGRDLSTADLDGGVVVLSVRAGAYFGFNGVASEIWQFISEPCRVGEILSALSQSHDVDAATLSRDVLPFLQTLIDRELALQVDQDGIR
jgi:hypothetical protein